MSEELNEQGKLSLEYANCLKKASAEFFTSNKPFLSNCPIQEVELMRLTGLLQFLSEAYGIAILPIKKNKWKKYLSFFMKEISELSIRYAECYLSESGNKNDYSCHPQKYLSSCCNERVAVRGGSYIFDSEEGPTGQTFYHVCMKCSKPCDVIV